MQGSLPAGWLAFTGRELNPLDRDEGFQITSSSLPGLFLAQRPKTCTLPAHYLHICGLMHCSTLSYSVHRGASQPFISSCLTSVGVSDTVQRADLVALPNISAAWKALIT